MDGGEQRARDKVKRRIGKDGVESGEGPAALS